MKPTTLTKAELYAEREATSKAMLKLTTLAERLIERIKHFNRMAADDEARLAELEMRKIRRGR